MTEGVHAHLRTLRGRSRGAGPVLPLVRRAAAAQAGRALPCASDDRGVAHGSPGLALPDGDATHALQRLEREPRRGGDLRRRRRGGAARPLLARDASASARGAQANRAGAARRAAGLAALDTRAADDRIAAVVEAHPGLALAVVVG